MYGLKPVPFKPTHYPNTVMGKFEKSFCQWLKPRFIFQALAARMKPCPFKTEFQTDPLPKSVPAHALA